MPNKPKQDEQTLLKTFGHLTDDNDQPIKRHWYRVKLWLRLTGHPNHDRPWKHTTTTRLNWNTGLVTNIIDGVIINSTTITMRRYPYNVKQN